MTVEILDRNGPQIPASIAKNPVYFFIEKVQEDAMSIHKPLKYKELWVSREI